MTPHLNNQGCLPTKQKIPSLILIYGLREGALASAGAFGRQKPAL